MTLRMLGLAIVAMSGMGSPAAQDVYRYIDEAGRPVFTDQPPAGREVERLELPPPAAAGSDPEQRLERITETATLLKEDRLAREARRDELRRESARRAHEAAMAQAAVDAAREPRPVSGGGYPAWKPAFGRWPGWHPGLRPPGHFPGHFPGHLPTWPPSRPEWRPLPGGILRAGPGTKGW